MDSLLALIGLAVVAFASTNIDDVFILVGFFADRNFRAHDVVLGQYMGISTLYLISALAALVSLVIPASYIGLLGLAPIAIGIKKAMSSEAQRGGQGMCCEHRSTSAKVSRCSRHAS